MRMQLSVLANSGIGLLDGLSGGVLKQPGNKASRVWAIAIASPPRLLPGWGVNRIAYSFFFGMVAIWARMSTTT